jgi:glycosyltransferase involved in cell wall biosynthesis
MTTPKVWFPAIRCGSGADVFTERLCAALNAQGIRAEITWLPHRAEYAPWSVPVPKPPAWANVVHINSWLPQRFVPPGLSIVVTVHSSVHDPALLPYKSRLQALYHKHWIHPIEAANLERAHCVVAVSHYTAAQIEASFGIRDIQVIHNGIDCQAFTPIARTEPNHPFRLLYVGNWSARKGVDLLGPIMERLGNGFLLQYTADRNGAHTLFRLPPNSACLGRLAGKDLVRAYQEADALLFPSRLEGLPLVPLEAMACGLPVIAAKTSSLPELVEDGVTGVLCPQDDVAAFAAQIGRLAENPAAWCAMRQTARQRATSRFDERVMVHRYREIYGAVMD